MPSSNVAPKLDLNVTLRGDVGVISAISDVELLEREVVRFARLSKGWSHSSYYRQGDQVFVHAGKLPQVIDHLIRQGHWIEPGMSANWPQRSHVVPPNDVLGLAPCEVDLLHSVGDKPWGQIIASRGLIPRMISAITKFFSRANVLVVARNTEAGNRIARELELGTNRQISTGQIIPWNKQPLVHIDSLAGLCRSNQDWQVLIFADAESARSATGMQQAASMPESLIIAMIPADQQLDWEDQLRIRVTCGPVVYRLSDDPGAGTAVSVLTVRAYRSRRQVSRNGLIRKRCHLWHNEKRNQQIATIAESFADGNWDRLTACGITVDAIQQQRQAIGQHPRVAILVESPEHARSLRRVLPGWRMATGRRLADQHLPTFPLDAQRVIITQARARAAGLAADVIIRADGTGQGWSKDYGPHWGFNGDNLIIVDLQDAFDMRARDSGYSRLADYRDRGWDVIELTACQALTR